MNNYYLIVHALCFSYALHNLVSCWCIFEVWQLHRQEFLSIYHLQDKREMRRRVEGKEWVVKWGRVWRKGCERVFGVELRKG